MKKNVDYYMSLPYRTEIVPDPEEGGVALSCPELPGCITCAEDIVDGYAMLEDAKASWFRSCLENGIDIPMPALKKLMSIEKREPAAGGMDREQNKEVEVHDRARQKLCPAENKGFF